jgi:rare lipoprotein A
VRPDKAMRPWRRARLGAGALLIAVFSCAAALAAAQALAAPARQPIHTTSRSVPADAAARVRVRPRPISVLGGQAIHVRGSLLPALAGRKVSLQGRRSGRWQTLTSTRTGSAGRFALRYVANTTGREPIRVKFAGDSSRGQSTAKAGQMTVYREAGASWYNDGGTTACGFHAQYGVANRTLPCGTKVAFRYNGRSVTAIVDDRGPYVGGRDWDLNQTTAGALGFGGVATVWSSQ